MTIQLRVPRQGIGPVVERTASVPPFPGPDVPAPPGPDTPPMPEPAPPIDRGRHATGGDHGR